MVASKASAGPASYRVIVLASVLGQLVLTTDYALVAAMLPSIAHAFLLSAADCAWVVATDLLCFAGFLIFGGRLTDVLGIRSCFLGSVIGYALGCIVSASASSLPVLVAGRAIQGVSAAILSPASFAMLTVLLPDPLQRRWALGVLGMTQGLSLIIGLIGAGVLAQTLGWRAGFLINLPLLLLCFLIGRSRLPRAERQSHVASGIIAVVPAAMLVVVSTALLLWSLSRVGQQRGLDRFALIGLAGAAIAGLLLVRSERRVAVPLIPRSFFRPSIIAHGASGLLAMFGSGAFFLLSNIQLQAGFGLAPAYASLALMPYALAVVVGGQLAAKMLSRFRGVLIGAGGTLALAIGLGWLGLFAQADTYALGMLPAMVLAGMGGVMSFLGRMADYSGQFPEEEQGTATAFLFTLHQIGLAAGATGASSVVGRVSLVQLTGGALSPAYFLAAVVALGGAIALRKSRQTIRGLPIS